VKVSLFNVHHFAIAKIAMIAKIAKIAKRIVESSMLAILAILAIVAIVYRISLALAFDSRLTTVYLREFCSSPEVKC
jgi:hypothetical protein